PREAWRTWSFEPGIVIPLVAAGVAYAAGVRRLWVAAGTGRGIRRAQAAAFAAGWFALVVALVSPLDAVSNLLFSAHMVQHELLMVVAAPLVVLGAPLVAVLWMLPIGWRKALTDASRRTRLGSLWLAISAPAA